MIYWKDYTGHKVDLKGKRKKFDNTIYTFDIETTSFLVLDNKQYNSLDYLKFNEQEKENSIPISNMYIWMFSINDTVYYGRTWDEFYSFLLRIENWATDCKKYVFVHNLSYEFQFLINKFKVKNVFARKSRKVIKFELEDFNFEFRCSLMMSNCKLEKLAEVYQLPIKKLVGNLDYNTIRNSKTKLNNKELSYCKNDCLIIYHYILKELETYETLKALPLTHTGHVRKEFKDKINLEWSYKNKVRRAINVNSHIYNLLIKAFAGGYTHSNWIFTGKVINDKIVSYDFTSSYPYVMCCCQYPATEFLKINVTKKEQLKDCFAYLINVKFKNIKCKYYNNFISQSKCSRIFRGHYDNGRVISAEELEIVVTDIDFKFICETYEYEECEFIEVYYSIYEYLPQQYIEYILQKYEDKTKFKNVEGKEVEYAIAKAQFNSLYGMTVTNNIKDNVIFENEKGWSEVELTNEEIQEYLDKEKDKSFLSFAYGVWVTAWARYNLLSNLIKLDEFVLYADTDSLKLRSGFDIKVIEDYNNEVIKKIEKVSNDLDIDIKKFKPVDTKGVEHLLGVFDNDGSYSSFITQGAKKYAYIDNKDNKIHITVAGVPKKGAKALQKLEDFKDDFVFKYEDTGKNLMIYNDEQIEFELEDYQGHKELLKNKHGAILLPTTYVLGKSEEYCELLSDESSKRAIYKE